MILSIKGNWVSVEASHKNFLESKINNFLLQQHLKVGPKSLTVHFVEKSKRLLISNKIKDLTTAARYYDFIMLRLKTNKSQQKNLKSELKSIFDYHNFIVKSIGYDAYDLCSHSKSRTCPYCNQAYAFTVQFFKKGYRPTLDHYFPKDKYPHLSLSLYNLVPACANCNSSLKGEINFVKEPHLHPLFDEERINFSLETAKLKKEIVKIVDVNVKEFKIKITHCTDQKTINSLNTFIIEERYQSFIFEAVNFARAKIYCDELMQNTQIDIVNEIDESAALMFNHNKYQDHLLGKLYQGIYKQFS